MNRILGETTSISEVGNESHLFDKEENDETLIQQ